MVELSDAAKTTVRFRTLCRFLQTLRDRGEIGFTPAIDQKAERDAAACAAVLEVLSPAGEEESWPWVFPGHRELLPCIHRGLGIATVMDDMLGNQQATQIARPAAASSRALRIATAPGPSGGHLTQAVGFARAAGRSDQSSGGVAAFLDSDALDSPDFHEGLNFGGVWAAPVLFVVFGSACDEVVEAASAYSVPAEQIAPEQTAWYAALRLALQQSGPRLLAMDTSAGPHRWWATDREGSDTGALQALERATKGELAEAYDTALHKSPCSQDRLLDSVFAVVSG